MAFPKKQKGWRKIVVDGREFRWRFTIHETGTLICQGPSNSSQQLIVSLPKWFDPWLFIGHQHLLPNTPAVVTPKLAAEAIRFGLANGWQPDESAFPLRAVYENGTFHITPPLPRQR
jgi:hypothetical protein